MSGSNLRAGEILTDDQAATIIDAIAGAEWIALDVGRPVAHVREIAGHANPKRAAEALGMPASTYRSLESCGGGAKVARLAALAAELGVELRIEARARRGVVKVCDGDPFCSVCPACLAEDDPGAVCGTADTREEV